MEPTSEKETIIFEPENWKVRKTVKRKNRMQIRFNMSQQEAESWVNFCRVLMPEGVDEEEFIKVVFFQGCNAIQNEMVARAREAAENDPELKKAMEAAEDRLVTPVEEELPEENDSENPKD